MVLVLLPILLILFFGHSDAGYTEEERMNWIDALETFQVISHPHKQDVIQVLDDIVVVDKIKITAPCRIQLREFSAGLKTGNLSQMLMFDSFSKPPGIMSSQGFNLGSHRQCLHQGRYVLFGIQFPLPDNESITKLDHVEGREEWISFWSRNIGFFRGFPFYAAICIPDACRDGDVREVFNSHVVNDRIEPLRLELTISESFTDDIRITWMQIGILLIITQMAQSVMLATVINLVFPGTGIANWLKPFDAIRNIVHLVKDRDPKQRLTSAFDLLRVVYVLVAFFSTVLFGMSSVLLFRSQVFTASYTPLLAQFFKGIPAFTGFNLIIAASLSAYHWLTIMSRDRVSFPKFAIIRIVRPLPVMLFMILFYSSLPLVPYQGPFSNVVQQDLADKCYNNGWRELLFISNLYPVTESCNVINWFLSVDTQLYLASFLILVIISKHQKAGLTILLAAIIAGTIGSGIYSRSNDLPAYLNLNIDQTYKMISSMHKILYHTIHHVAAYGIGMLLGYTLWKQEGRSRAVGSLGLLAAVTPIAAFAAFPALAYDEDYQFYFGPFAESVYTFTARPIASLCTAVMMYAVLNTDNKIIRYITESKIIVIMSRLSYCMLASHTIIINYVFATLETQLTTTIFLVITYLFVLVFGIILAAMLYLTVEAPWRNLMISRMSAVKSKTM